MNGIQAPLSYASTPSKRHKGLAKGDLKLPIRSNAGWLERAPNMGPLSVIVAKKRVTFSFDAFNTF